MKSREGYRFKFATRDNEEWNGIAYTWIFNTKKGETVEVKLPFKDAKPTKFAKIVDADKLDTSRLVTLQLTLSKFEFDGDLNPAFGPGEFCVDLESIDLY